MIRRRGIPPVVWLLVGLLAVSAFAISLGNRESETTPSVSNFDPSGLAALYTLLERSGYNVSVDLSDNPHLGSHDVAICLRSTETVSLGKLTAAPDQTFTDSLDKFVKAGGRAVVFGYVPEFAAESHATLAAGPIEVQNHVTPRTLHIMDQYRDMSGLDLPVHDSGDVSTDIWYSGQYPLVWANKTGKGVLVVSGAGLTATNRFLDKADDADFVLSTIDIVAKPGDHIVFTEASFGNVSNPGFLETLGAWALAGWRQAIVLFLVLVYSLGKRFGYPEERRRSVQSSRNLADAFGNLLRRSKRVDLGLEMATARIDQRIRTYFRVPRDASREERDRVLPESVLKAMKNLENASKDPRTGADEALKLVRKADAEIDEYVYLVTHERTA